MTEHGTLEANICRHCQNRCISCSHGSPWAKPYFMEPDQLARDLDALKKVLTVQQFYCLGGEPLLHPRILDLLDVGRASGIAKENCILTNGRLLPKMPEAFWTKLDVIRISVYPTLDRSVIELAEQKKKQYGFYLGLDFISTFWKQFEVSFDGRTFDKCPWKGGCWTVHDGYFYLCPQSAFFTDQFMGLAQNIDGLPLHDGLTDESFKAYLNRKEPYNACRICHSYKVQVPWREAGSLEEWIQESTI